jgi:2'-5' RNA ligase superfamily
VAAAPPTRCGGETAIVVLVPEAEPAAGDWRREHMSDGARGMPAHVTVLYPFAPEPDLDAVRALAARAEPFRFTLRAVREWPDGVVYLEPDPAAPFIGLTRALVERFPDHQPYEGAFPVDEVVPHLTVVHTDDGAVRADAAASVAESLPIRCDANEIWLMHEVNGRWQRHTPFRLGR